jgi:hypothetical protein
MAPYIINLGARCRFLLHFTDRMMMFWERTPLLVPNEELTYLAPGGGLDSSRGGGEIPCRARNPIPIQPTG